MKAKLLLVLFLLSFSLCSFAVVHDKKTPRIKKENMYTDSMVRYPFEPSMQVDEMNDCLLLTFQFALDDVSITIKDTNGNEVVNEQQVAIYEGKAITISGANSYPYFIEINSPTIIIHGEIVLEE